jgi:hypothetical protein
VRPDYAKANPDTVRAFCRALLAAIADIRDTSLMRNVATGGLELYDISNNRVTGSFLLGNVGLDWQFAGIGPLNGAGTSDLVLRDVPRGIGFSPTTGGFEVYDITNNQITATNYMGAVGLDFQVGGFAADPPAGSGSTAQLVQAMAGFGSGSAVDASNTTPLGADTSQQQFLTTPQHA